MIHLSYLHGLFEILAVLIAAGLFILVVSISISVGQGYELHGLVKIIDPVQGLLPGIGGGHALC